MRLQLLILPAIAASAAASLRAGGDSTPAGLRSGTAPDFELHYAPEESLEAIDAGLIGSARSKLDVMAYVLTDRTVFGALEEAARRGVKVRIWRDARMAAELGDVDLAGASSNFEIRTSHGAELMHLKGSCVASRGAALRVKAALPLRARKVDFSEGLNLTSSCLKSAFDNWNSHARLLHW
jgi:PLD-like domain